MNLKQIFFFTAFMAASFLKAQTYSITNFYMTKGGQPHAVNGRIEIKDSTYTCYIYSDKDTTKESNKILRVEGTTYFLDNGYAKIFTLSELRTERKEGVYYIESTKDIKNPKRSSLFYRVVRID